MTGILRHIYYSNTGMEAFRTIYYDNPYKSKLALQNQNVKTQSVRSKQDKQQNQGMNGGSPSSSISLLCNDMRPLKYLTVLTLSSSVASSSQTKIVCGCIWNADTVHIWLTPSSMALFNANALWAPVIRIITCDKKSQYWSLVQ